MTCEARRGRSGRVSFKRLRAGAAAVAALLESTVVGLPVALTVLLGRGRELAAIDEQIPRPGVRLMTVLATGRSAPRIRGERVFPLSPLPLPRAADAEALAANPAVAVFVERAQEADPAFSPTREDAPVIAEIRPKLGGLPLAIELAAARITLPSPAVLLARVDNRLALLTKGPRDLPDRQRTPSKRRSRGAAISSRPRSRSSSAASRCSWAARACAVEMSGERADPSDIGSLGAKHRTDPQIADLLFLSNRTAIS